MLGLPSARWMPMQARFEALGGIHGLWLAGAHSLSSWLLPAEAERLEAAFVLAERLLCPPNLPAAIDGPEALVAFVRPRLGVLPYETFSVVPMDIRGRPLALEQVSQGTLSACLVHPREVFAPALRLRAASIIAVHNHPSGDPDPSAEDWALTARLQEASRILGIPLIDHVVVARGGYFSLGGVAPFPGMDGTLLASGAAEPST